MDASAQIVNSGAQIGAGAWGTIDPKDYEKNGKDFMGGVSTGANLTQAIGTQLNGQFNFDNMFTTNAYLADVDRAQKLNLLI